jgi:type I restriction enzyme R subunit
MMPHIETERETQNRMITLFQQQLGYTYLGNWQYRAGNSNIEPDLLRAFLKQQGHSDPLINKALHELQNAAIIKHNGLYDANRDVYRLLRYGIKVQPDVGKNHETVFLIDWKNPTKNHFAIAEEVTLHTPHPAQKTHPKRPDIVLYVNGIALGVLELKRSSKGVTEGIRQNYDSQKPEFIRPFFSTMQLVMAGNTSQGLRYGTIETPERYFLAWKEPSETGEPLDRDVLNLCNPKRFLEIIHDFTVFDAGRKKLCRHNQYFGIKAAQEKLRRREGGIIWHTQGSGKSLTMVMLARWIRENITDSRVVIITDRTELDEQIQTGFIDAGETIHRTTSGADLLAVLNKSAPAMICSLVHKFSGKDDGDVGDYVRELNRTIPTDFRAKGDVYVFVDECHRTQSGDLHKAMKKFLPHAVFIGFTGTPLLKNDKATSIATFGGYIHTYKFDEAVTDGVVLDLCYEARDINQYLSSHEKINQWFNAKTRGMNDIARATLKQKWGTMQRVLSARSRLEKIVADILMDMETKDRLMSGRGNAMLVSDRIYNACRFYELFQQTPMKGHCAIVTSYAPNIGDIKGEDGGEGSTERLKQHKIYNDMLGDESPEEFEKRVKRQFKEQPAQMKLLIVVDKLLTGFDVPSATYLYIDQNMRDHGLFQAICRVNRLDDKDGGEDKEYGYIIDYKDLFKSLESSIQDYTSEAFDDYDEDDVKGLLSDRIKKGRERLDEAREAIKALCESVAPPKGTLQYQHYFCAEDTADKDALKNNEPKRLALYKLTTAYLRAYAGIANDMAEAGYSEAETTAIKQEAEQFHKIRDAIKLASGDYVDLKNVEPAMRHLIDSYVQAEDSRIISNFDEKSLLQIIGEKGVDFVEDLPTSLQNDSEATSEAVENNLRRVITDEQPINPRYYAEMADLLDTLIEQRKQKSLDYAQYLKELVALSGKISNPEQHNRYPATLNKTERVLYDNLDNNEQLAIDLDDAIRGTIMDNWLGNIAKERTVRAAIRGCIGDNDALVEHIFELVKKQDAYQ